MMFTNSQYLHGIQHAASTGSLMGTSPTSATSSLLEAMAVSPPDTQENWDRQFEQYFNGKKNESISQYLKIFNFRCRHILVGV